VFDVLNLQDNSSQHCLSFALQATFATFAPPLAKSSQHDTVPKSQHLGMTCHHDMQVATTSHDHTVQVWSTHLMAVQVPPPHHITLCHTLPHHLGHHTQHVLAHTTSALQVPTPHHVATPHHTTPPSTQMGAKAFGLPLQQPHINNEDKEVVASSATRVAVTRRQQQLVLLNIF
jgi:hypothetical protein